MFSTLIEKILLEFLGEYIDGIKNSMDVALLKGIIKIENVSLKKDFFNNLSLPLRLAFSLIESIHIHIPWSSLKDKSTIVEVDGIYALFYVNYELEEYQFDPEKRLNEMIDKATQLIKMKFQEKQRDSQSTVEKYILRIIDNLKVSVKNVHIRMESIQKKWDFSMGLMLDDIEVYTSNEKGDRHFFVRSRRHGHIFLHHRREKHDKDDELFKKVFIKNARLYFTQYETNFITHLHSAQHKLREMKSILLSDNEMLLGEQRAQNQPNIVLRINLESIIKVKLNDKTNKYDIDVQTNICPLTLNLTDRMTANMFYFLQFAFQWQMRKYKRPGNLVDTSSQMINFYKLMLYNILSSTPIHKSDYKTLLRVVSTWQYAFLNQITIQFVQQQKIKKQLSRRKNRKISDDVIILEQFKKEIEDRILTEQEKKEIFNIIGRIEMEIFLPTIEVILTRSKDQCDIFALRQQQVMKIGCSGISVKSNTLWLKQQLFTLQIDDLIFFSQTQLIEKKISQQPLQEIIYHPPFLRVIYTKQIQQKVQSISINIEKRLIHINQKLIQKLIQWVGCIKLRPPTVNYLKEIFVHYTTEIVKILLEKLFKEFRVVDVNIHLPIVEVGVRSGESYIGSQNRKRQDALRVDLGKFQGKLLQQGIYHFQFTQSTSMSINSKPIATITAGTSIQILDKKPLPPPTLNQQTIPTYLIDDRQKIMLKLPDISLHHIDILIQFICTLIQSPIIQQFLKTKIIDNQSILLEGVFYLNNSPYRQHIVMRNDYLYFLPSRYRISLKLCKVYKMKLQMRNYLVFHQFMSNISDIVEVENQRDLDTIFYKIRQQIHELATISEWDQFYKTDYPVVIDRLDVLKSHHGENQPLFNFECYIGKIVIPLERYLHNTRQKEEKFQKNDSIEEKLQGKNALQLLQFFESQPSNQHMYGRKPSTLSISQIYLKLSCYQLTNNLFTDIKQLQLMIQNQPIINNFSLSLSLIKTQSFLMNIIINQFQLSLEQKEQLKNLIQIGSYFEEKVEELIQIVRQCDLVNRIQQSLQENENQQVSSLQSLNVTQHDASRMYQPKGIFRMQHSLLLTLRMNIKFNAFKMNVLNYITQMKNVQHQVQIYRSENFPLIKIKASNIIFMNALHLNHLQLRIEKNHNIKESSIDCYVGVQKIRGVFNIEVFMIDLAQGELGELICYVLDHLAQRKKHEIIKVTKREEPHVRFDDFISPIKSMPSATKKQPFHTMKSIHDELKLENQVNTINLQLSIREVKSQIILSEGYSSIIFQVQQISLKQNTLSIWNIKSTQYEQTIMNCKSIVITLPQYKQEVIANFSQDIVISDIHDKFQSPRKNQVQEPLVHHSNMQPQTPSSTNPTTVLIDNLQFNFYVNSITDILSFIHECTILMRKSTQFTHLRQNVSHILLKTLQNRQQISTIIDISKYKLNELTKNIRKEYQSKIEFKLPFDLENMLKYVSISTTNHQPIIIDIYSHDLTQLLSTTINFKIDFPNFSQSSIVIEISHFNKILHIFQPILERTEINIQRVKQQIQINIVKGMKIVFSQQFLVDSLKQVEYISQKVNNNNRQGLLLKEIPLQNTNVVQQLNIRKKKLYQNFTSSSIRIQQTQQDLQQKQSKSKIISNQFSLQPTNMLLSSNRQQLLRQLGRNCSKIEVKNYTGCGVICELVQDALKVQQLRLSEQDKQENKLEEQQYFVIPLDMKSTRFTSTADFIDRQKPMSLKVRFQSYLFLFKQSFFEMDILFDQVCRVGMKSKYFELSYKYSSGNFENQQVKSTIIEIMISFNRQRDMFAMEIRPLVQVINGTVLDIGLRGQQQHVLGESSIGGQNIVLGKNATRYLPFWVSSALNITLPHYHSTSQHQDSYQLPLALQQNLQENYPKQQTIMLKQSLVHYFPVLLGTQKCWIPLVFVKIKKYERYTDERRQNKWDFRQTKCRVLVLPFIKMENHLEKSLWVNGEVSLGRRERMRQRSEGLLLSSNQQSKQHQNSQHQKQQQAIYFFLLSQVDSSITHLMLSFSPQGYNYHIPLPQHLYVPKPLTFPTQSESLTPIAFNFLSTKNTYDQIILHIYPLIQISMEIPLKGVSLKMTARVDEKGKEKDCQGLIVKEGKMEQQQQKSENDKLDLHMGRQKICYLLSEQYKLIKLQLLIVSTANLQSKDAFYFTSAMPDKKSLSFINLFGDQFKKISTSSSSQTSNEQSSSSSSGSSQSIKSQSNSQPSSSQSISSIFQQQSQDIKSIATRQFFIPTITHDGQMLFCHCLIKRIEKKFSMQEELPNVCTVDVIDDLRQSEQNKRKYEKYFQFEIVWLNQEDVERNKSINQNRVKLIEEELASQIKQVPKLKEIEQKLTKKLSSKLINIFINTINLSLIVNKAYLPSQQFQNDAFSSSSFTTSQRFELINMTLGEIRANLSFTIDDLANDIYQIQLEQQIGKLMLNSINCQRFFNQSILKLNEHKSINLLLGFSMRTIFSINQKDVSRRQYQGEDYQNLTLCPSFELNKMLLKIVDLHQKEQKSNDYHFHVKATDQFILQMFNWLIKMYPMISAVVTPNTHKSLLEIILESDSFNEFLQQFDGLMLCEEMKLKLSFISVSKKNSSLNTKKTKKINKETQNKKVQNFLSSILQQNVSQQFSASQVETAIRQSKTMRRILKYIKKIPFSVLQVENSLISIPEIAINGKLDKETLEKFERQIMINFATGIIKGMKLLGSPSSIMDYLQKNKNKKKRQKLSGLLNKLAKGSIHSFTGILKSISNGISQLTFDDKFLQQRQETMESSNVTDKSQKSNQGLKSLFLGIKSGFAGLVQQPVQNYQEEGAQGLIKGTIKGVTGLFTKPLAGILDLGTKTLQNVGTQNKNSLNKRFNLLQLQKTTYCRPLFYECSLIRGFTQSQYLAFIALKGSFGNDKEFGQISAFELKQNPFNFEQQVVEKQNVALKLLDPIRYLLSISYEKTHFIQIGNEKDHRLVYNQLNHKCIKIIGRDQKKVCLVVQKKNIGNDQDEEENLQKNQINEIILNPFYLDEKQEIFQIYKKLTKK